MISPFYEMINVMGRVSMADQSSADNWNNFPEESKI